MKLNPTAILLTLVALACQQGDSRAIGRGTELRDSAGIRIIENLRPPEGSRLGWRIGPEPIVSIGQVEGEEPYLLHLAFNAFRFPDGSIVVANRGTHEVRKFDEQGTHLRTWGGTGEGPGEFLGLTRVAPWPGDSIIAWYGPAYRLSVFDANGEYGRAFDLQSSEEAIWLRPRPIAVRDDGTVVSIHDPENADTVVIDIWDGDGALVGSLGTHPGREVIVTPTGELRGIAFGRDLVRGTWGDLVVASPTTRYEIRAFRPDGTLVRIVRLEHVPRAPAEADLEWYIDDQVAMVGSSPGLPEGFIAQMRQSLQSTQLATTFPAFSAIRSDDADHLWVREYDYPGEERPAPLWTVFDPAGRVLGYVETPNGMIIQQIGEDYILGHTRDELGVEYVQVWPLERWTSPDSERE
ncbi:MAG: hypothetical protein F4087_02260 [Gemmatimonadetes bacterium]|nr:hypothetical protein [Gemmatimonadota bacterium]MYE70167.1 hypothetical protein [Gemmatimonadota bacterium]MYJ67323.1 hypothetical protein [Gemmatimonadota bacterium]